MVITTSQDHPPPVRTLAQWLARNEGASVTEKDLREAMAVYTDVGGEAAFAVINLLARLRP